MISFKKYFPWRQSLHALHIDLVLDRDLTDRLILFNGHLTDRVDPRFRLLRAHDMIIRSRLVLLRLFIPLYSRQRDLILLDRTVSHIDTFLLIGFQYVSILTLNAHTVHGHQHRTGTLFHDVPPPCQPVDHILIHKSQD